MPRRFVVAGGLGALGRAVVNKLADKGFAVAAIDLAFPLECPGQLAFGGVDLTDEPAVVKAYADAAVALGGIDGVVNVAGGFLWETIAAGSIESWDKMYSMNLRTAAISSRAAMAHLRQGGSIVNVGAAAATYAAAGMGAYAASKAGVMALTESLADELRTDGIRVNAVLPTIIDTPANRSDMPDADTSTWVKAESVADVVSFLLSAESAAITGVGIKLSVAG